MRYGILVRALLLGALLNGVALGGPVYRVTTAKATGAGSLADAIGRANASRDGARIEFAIPAAEAVDGAWTIHLDAPLPPVTAGGVVIEGPGETPAVAIIAAKAGVDHAMSVVSAGNTVKGLAIGGFKHGLVLYGPAARDNRIIGNHIGPCAANETGVILVEGAKENVLEDNVISGNRSIGVYIGGRESTGNILRRNRIGCDPAGAKPVPNSIGVMLARAAENTIGEGNIVSGNSDIGILLAGKWTSRNRIRGNFIGTDATGTRLLHNDKGIVIKGLANDNLIGGADAPGRNIISGNLEIGVYIEASDGNRIIGNHIGPDITGRRTVQEGERVQGNGIEFNTVAKNNTLGGTAAGERNIISGNKVYGVVYYGNCEKNATVGNYIGTDITGSAALPNATGVCVDCASHDNDISRNVISGNLNYGLFFVTRGTERNTLRANLIGTTADGLAALPNDIGMVIATGAAGNTVGGDAPADGNIISGNRQSGLLITNRLTENNRIAGNRIGINKAGQPLPNGHGVVFSTYPRNNTLVRNTIRGNATVGVAVYEHADDNRIGDNTIEDNAGGGILIHGSAGAGNTLTGNAVRANGKFQTLILPQDKRPATRPARIVQTPPNKPAGLAHVRGKPMPAGGRAVLTVSNTNDAGPGSLRHAVNAANQRGGHALIAFDIRRTDARFNARAGTWTITFADTPPALTVSDVIIDGFSQEAASNHGPSIVLDGANHSIEYAFLLLGASDVTIRGLAIQGFVYGIQIHSQGATRNRVVGCRIGVDAVGVKAAPNYNGIELLSGAAANFIGGPDSADRNIISGNAHTGIRISDAGRNVVQGNLVGLDATGTAAVPNYDGIAVEGRSRGNLVGGSLPSARNIVSGNIAYGIDLFGAGVQENRVLGNYLGTDVTGTRAVPNTYGLLFDDRASRNVVGGLAEGEGNVISGNTAFGAYFYNNGTNSNAVIGNRIGTDPAGTSAVPNETGVHIDGATTLNLVDSNLISGNLVAGVTIFAPGTDNNFITRNRIGTVAAGDQPLPNGADGIRIAFGPKNNTIGGAEAGNTIAHNGGWGIQIESGPADANRIEGNDIRDNELGRISTPGRQVRQP